MDEFENPYICFNCAKVGKCQKAIYPTHDTSVCKDYEKFDEPQYVQTSFKKLAEIFEIKPHTLYAKMKRDGWSHIVELFAEKGMKIYREKSGSIDKRSKSHKYVYYIKE